MAVLSHLVIQIVLYSCSYT